MAFDEKLAANARRAVQGSNERWILPVGTLNKIAHAVPEGTEPDQCFSWERERLSQQPKFHPEQRVDRDEFLDALYQKGIGKSRDDVETWWYHFCNHALNWWLTHNRPVDMYVIKLWPTLLRSNWHELVVRNKIRGTDQAATANSLLKNQEFIDRMKSPYNLAMARHNTIDAAIEVEHSRNWWRVMRAVEKKRLKLLNGRDYAEHILRLLKDGVERAAILYAEWAQRTALAQPTISNRLDKRSGWLVPVRSRLKAVAEIRRAADRRRESIHRSGHRRRRVAAEQKDLEERLEMEREAFEREQQAELLRLLSHEKRKTRYLWNTGGNVPQPTNGEA